MMAKYSMSSFKTWFNINEFAPTSTGADAHPTGTAAAANKVAGNWMKKPGSSDNVANIMQARTNPSLLPDLITKNAATALRGAQPSLANKITPADVGRQMTSELFPKQNKRFFQKKKMRAN